MPKYNMNIDDAKTLARLVSSAFLWAETPQGVQYWQEVERNVWELIRDAEGEDPHGNENAVANAQHD